MHKTGQLNRAFYENPCLPTLYVSCRLFTTISIIYPVQICVWRLSTFPLWADNTVELPKGWLHPFVFYSFLGQGNYKAVCRKCSIYPAQTSLSLFALLLATFFSLLAANGHISMKINFILDPLGADVSANLCQDRFNMMAKRKFLYFISVLYCPVFLIMEPKKTWKQGLFFCVAHLPTMDKYTGPSLLARLQSDYLWDIPRSSSTGIQQPYLQAQLHSCPGFHPGFCCQWRSGSLCRQQGFLSIISLFDIGSGSILCVHWKPNVIAQR